MGGRQDKGVSLGDVGAEEGTRQDSDRKQEKGSSWEGGGGEQDRGLSDGGKVGSGSLVRLSGWSTGRERSRLGTEGKGRAWRCTLHCLLRKPGEDRKCSEHRLGPSLESPAAGVQEPGSLLSKLAGDPGWRAPPPCFLDCEKRSVWQSSHRGVMKTGPILNTVPGLAERRWKAEP